VLDIVYRDDARAYAIVSDAGFNTSLIRWSPATGTSLGTLYSPGGFSLADAELTPDGDEVWVCNSSFGSPGIRVFSTATQQPVGTPIACTLPPQGLSFDTATSQVAGVNTPPAPGLALAPPSPNPARTAVRLAFRSPGAGTLAVDIVDLAGRRVRAFAVAVGAGPAQLDWDLSDESGQRVSPGLYFVSVRLDSERATRPVLVVR
jgi:DNA-binding beta-propeller fold protein YncE